MDHHKRGYSDLDNEAVLSSPTKRLKDLSHHSDYLSPHHHESHSCRSLRVRYHAQVSRSQYKTRIQYGRPQICRARRAQQPEQIPKADSAAAAPRQTPAVMTAPTRNDWIGRQRELDVESQIEDSAYHRLLPLVKQELERWELKRAAERLRREGVGAANCQADDETMCAVCLNPRKFKGWDALLIHAQKYCKQMPSQHRGFYRALQEALFERAVADRQFQGADAENATTFPGASAPAVPAHPKLPQVSKPSTNVDMRKVTDHQTSTRTDVKRWRPDILIVENEQFGEVGHILEMQQRESDQSHAGRGQKAQLREILAVYSDGDGADEQSQVFVFPASKVGFVGEAEVNSYRQISRMTDQRQNPQSEDQIPAAEREKFNDVGRAANSTSEAGRARPNSGHTCVTINDGERCESLKEALGLRLTLEEQDEYTSGQKLFDEEQIRPTSCVMERWVESFTTNAEKFQVQRVFRDSSKLVATDEGFRADLKRIKTYSPACKRKIKEHTSKIEDCIREDHLMWLQQLDEVREQFQALADDMQNEETRSKRCTMRAELEMWKQRQKHEKEEQHEALREARAKAILVVRRRKAKQRQERAEMMQLWMEDAKHFQQESAAANKERRRLEVIHGLVHDRAKQARKACPVCLESFRVKPCT